MTTHGKGEVVLVPVDFTDRSGSKFRPAVIVSDERYNRGPDRLIVSVTGNLDALPHPGDHVVADWREAGLRLPSLVQMKVATVESSLIVRTLGALRPAGLAAVEHGLALALGLNPSASK